jgi:rare lipoprotein A
MLTAWPAAAQNYSSTDTVTEYPNKGTYYHDRFEGRKTSNGEIFDQNKFTAAHWKIKLGTYVMVTNRNNGMQVIVRVNDRCPKHGVFDLSHRAATAIGIKGMQPVNVRLLGDGWHEKWLAQETMFDSVTSRLHPNVANPAATATPPVKTAPAKATPVAKKSSEPPKPATSTLPPAGNNRYDIELGMAASHSQAYNMIQMLPEIYRDKVAVETLEDDTTLLLTLTVALPEDNAEELSRALRHNFPNCKITPTE